MDQILQLEDTEQLNRFKKKKYTHTQDTSIHCLQDTRMDTERLKVNEMKKDNPRKGNEKAGIATLLPDKIDFETKTVMKSFRKRYYIMIKMSTKQENNNIYKYICTQNYKANIDRPKGINWQYYKNSREF